MDKKVIYLAGKMQGIKDLNYPAFYEMAAKLESKFDWEVINPAQYKYNDDDKFTYHKILFRDFCLIQENCQGIYMMKGWEDSSGACCELALARVLKLEIMFEDPTDASAIAWDMAKGVEYDLEKNDEARHEK